MENKKENKDRNLSNYNSPQETKKEGVITQKKITSPLISLKLNKKDKEIIKVLSKSPEGLRLNTIKKLANIKGNIKTFYNHLNKLKCLNLVENLYPIWKLCKNQILLEILQSPQFNNNIQAHKFSFVLPLIKKPDWWDKRKDRLIQLKEWHYNKDITFGNNAFEQIIKDSMQIQTFKNSIYFINQKEYYNSDPFLAFNEALNDVLNVISFLDEKFRFKFIISGNEQLTCISPHFVNIEDSLSKHCKKINNRFLIKSKEGYKLYVDFSEPFGTETNNPEIMRLYLRNLKDTINHPETPVPSEMWQFEAETSQNLKKMSEIVISNQNQINGLIEVAESRKQADIMMMENQKSHFFVLNKIGDAITKVAENQKSIIKEFTRLKEENKSLKLKIKHQKSIFDFS